MKNYSFSSRTSSRAMAARLVNPAAVLLFSIFFALLATNFFVLPAKALKTSSKTKRMIGVKSRSEEEFPTPYSSLTDSTENLPHGLMLTSNAAEEDTALSNTSATYETETRNVLKQDSTFEKDISIAGEEKKSASSSALLGHSKGEIHHHQHGEDEGNSDNDDEDDSSTSSTSDFYESLALDDDAVDFVDYNTYGARNGDDTDKVLEAMLEKKDDISLSSDGNAVTSGAPAKNVLKQDSTFEKDISIAGEEKKSASSSALLGHSKGEIHHHQHGEDEGNSDNDDEDDSSTSSTSDFYESLALDDDAVDFVDYNTYGARNGDDTDKVLEAMLEKKDDISLSSDGNAVTSGAPAKDALSNGIFSVSTL